MKRTAHIIVIALTSAIVAMGVVLAAQGFELDTSCYVESNGLVRITFPEDVLWEKKSSGGIATPGYLFGAIVTNEMYDATGTNQNYWTKDPYVERYRLFVELNQDGHEDVILSEPISQSGTGGLSYDVYLWTNGNYVCIGDIGGHLGSIKVEHINELTRVIWTYSHSSCQSGVIGTFVVEGWRCVDHRHCHIELGDEGRTPPTVGRQLLDIINKTATVPIRIEKTETKDGKVRWQPLGYNP